MNFKYTITRNAMFADPGRWDASIVTHSMSLELGMWEPLQQF